MKHLGDITKIDWKSVEPVDVVTGGSPCQDLSVAGKRAGLAGERSGLFMEQIRCVKELREQDVLRGRTGQSIRPRFMVWENVPGAFSSGKSKGSDFAAVIEEIIKVAEPDALVHIVPPDNGWPKSDCYYDADGKWSIAWRVHDAQFWGVPQRRKRIALVADFGGLSAPEVLFIRQSVSGHSEPCGEKRKETAGAVGGSVEGAEPILLESNQNHATIQTDGVCTALPASMGMGGGYVPMVTGVTYCHQGNGIDRADTAGCNGNGWREDVSYTLNTIDRPAVMAFDTTQITSPQNGCNPHYGDPCYPLAAGAHPPTICLNDQGGSMMSVTEDVAGTLRAQEHGHQPLVAGFRHKQGALAGNIGYQEEQAPTLNAEQQSAVYDARGNGDGQTVCTLTGDHQNRREDSEIYPVQGNIVRRLTPLECERLQGYPDGWTDIGDWTDSKGKKHKAADSPRYKALGNSIALPFWKWLLKRISAQYERDATLGSLFDGIGGFPYLWEQINGKGSARWASEIEEFPMAVTKIRFKEKD